MTMVVGRVLLCSTSVSLRRSKLELKSCSFGSTKMANVVGGSLEEEEGSTSFPGVA